MSEYLQSPKSQALILAAFTLELMEANTNKTGVEKMHEMLADAGPRVFITAVDEVVKQKSVTPEVKKGINKMLNVFYTHLNNLPQPEIKPGSFLDQMVTDNKEIINHFKEFRPLIKKVQSRDMPPEEIKNEILRHLTILEKVENHYQVMENIVFPFLERQWSDHRCFQVLWSIHDDVRREIGELKNLLESGKWDLKRFNRLTGDLFFDAKTIVFREEKIVLPVIVEAGLCDILDEHLEEVAETGWSFIELRLPEGKGKKKPVAALSDTLLDFATGKLTGEQIDLIFNHLPLDITFVDENDEVKYFSNPPVRTFARTPAVIGRTVQNCHPPESVWMVEKILDAFKKGKKDEASFWIPFKNQFVYIRYFAVRDEKGNYRGTIEVTQDVKEIRDLEGERRLLSWEDE